MKEWLQFIGMVIGASVMVVGSVTLAAIIIIALLPDREYSIWKNHKDKNY